MAFNQEKYIRDALEGFVNQKTNFEYEVLVHDDASTDATASIIAEYAQKYPHIIKPILQKENQYSKGVVVIDTLLIPMAKGEYYAMCEGDDYWTDEYKLQKQVDFLDQHPEYSACVHNSVMLEMQTQKKTVMFGDEDYDILPPHVLRGGSSCYQTASLMYRRDTMNKLPPFMQNVAKYGFGDYPLSIHLALWGPIRYMGKVMSVYRVGTESSWTSANRKDTHKNARFHRNMSLLLNEIHDYTEGAYGQQIEELILRNNYLALYFDEKYREMRKPEYAELYRQEPLEKRVKMRLKQYFLPLYHLYRNIKYGA